MDLKNFDLTHFLLALITIVLLSYAVSFGWGAVTGQTSTGTAAMIHIDGPIVGGNGLPRDKVTPNTVQNLVDQASDADAYIFQINSPGGGVVPSKDLARVIAEIDNPKACLFKSIAASGAYWAATECDHIVADSLSLTGSIGVNSAYLQFTGLMDEYGVKYVNLTAGKFKDAGSPFRNLTDEERQLFQQQLDQVHTEFISAVAENRNLSHQYVTNYSTGEVFLGKRAKEIGLIDQLGGKQEAVTYLESQTNMSLETKQYRPDKPFSFLSLLSTSIGQGIGQAFTEQLSMKSIENGYRTIVE